MRWVGTLSLGGRIGSLSVPPIDQVR
jgi:hypothetical protein